MPRQINDPGLFSQAAQSIAKKGNGYLGSIDTLDSMLRLALMDWVELLVDGTADLRQAKRIAIANARILLGMEPGYELVPGWNTAGGIDDFVARELGIDEVQPLARVEGAVIKFLSLITDIVEYSKRPDVVDEQWRWQVDAAIEEYAFLFVGINHAAAELLETAEPPASAADQLKEGWVTINTGEDDEGGQRIYIDDSGTIQSGHFKGKSLKQAFGKKADSAKQDPNDKTPPPKDDKPAPKVPHYKAKDAADLDKRIQAAISQGYRVANDNDGTFHAYNDKNERVGTLGLKDEPGPAPDEGATPKVKAAFTSMMGGPAKAVNSMIMDSPSALDKGMVDLAMDTVVPSEHSALADAIKKARPDLASDVDAIVAERKASQEKSQKQADEMKAMKSLHPSLASHFTAPNKTAMKAAFKDLDAAKHQDYVDSVGKLYGDEAKAVAASVMPKAKVPKAKPAKQQGLTPSQTWDPAMYDQHRKEAAALGKAAVGEWDSGATADQKAAMNWYADGGFRTVNTELRTGQPQDPKLDDQKKSWGKAFTNQELVANIDSLMAKNKTKQDVAAYRGVGPDEAKKLLAMKPGESIARPDYVSTSLNPSYAISGFANQTVGGGGVVMKINTPKGTPAMYLGDVEAELLLSRGNEFVMKGRSTVAGPNNTKVEMVEFDIKPKSAAKDPKPTKAPAPAALPNPPAGLDSFESDKVAQWQKAIAAGDVAKVSNASALDGIESDAAKAYHAQLLKAAGVKKTAAKPATVNPVISSGNPSNYKSAKALSNDFNEFMDHHSKAKTLAYDAYDFDKLPPEHRNELNAVSAFTAGGFMEMNANPNLPASKMFKSFIDKLPDAEQKVMYRVLAFETPEAQQAYIASIAGPHEQPKTFSSWTVRDPTVKGIKPMQHIGLDIASQFGEHEVILKYENPKGAKDVSFAYGSAKDNDGTELILQKGHRLETKSVTKDANGRTVVTVGPPSAKPKAADYKSKAKVVPLEESDSHPGNKKTMDIYKSMVKDVDMATLIGAPDDGEVGYSRGPYEWDDEGEGTPPPAVVMQVSAPGVRMMTREIRKEKGKIVMINHELETDKSSPGLGRAILKNQVIAARNAGVSEIRTQAAGGPGEKMNGYYTWPRYGYDASIASLRKTVPSRDKIEKMQFQNTDIGKKAKAKLLAKNDVLDKLESQFKAKSILDVMATQEGRDYWKANGWGFEGTFDLSEGSRSNKVLNAYLAAKGEL